MKQKVFKYKSFQIFKKVKYGLVNFKNIWKIIELFRYEHFSCLQKIFQIFLAKKIFYFYAVDVLLINFKRHSVSSKLNYCGRIFFLLCDLNINNKKELKKNVNYISMMLLLLFCWRLMSEDKEVKKFY